MRTLFKVSLAGAIALAAAVGCNKEVQYNPNYNPETKEVTTQFVLSVNTSTPQTRMSASTVQKATNFRGIDNGHILLFKSYQGTAPNQTALPYVFDPSLKAERDYPFATLYSSGDITAANNEASSSNRILQMTVPTGINTAIIYGVAPRESATGSEGKLVCNVSDTPANTSFSLSRRIGDADADVTAYDQTGALMAFVLNRILASSCPALDTYLTYTEVPAVSWRELGIIYEVNNNLHNTTLAQGGLTQTRDLTALEESLGRAYSEFTYIKPNEYRAGSSNAVKKMLQDMNSVVSSLTAPTTVPGNKAEANAKRLANVIQSRMQDYFTTSWEYKEIEDIETLVVTKNHLMSQTDWNAQFEHAKDLNKYPYQSFRIPEGAAQIKFDRDNGTVSYMRPNQALLAANPGDQYDPRNYVYPPELAYVVNSPLRISTKDGLQVSDFVNGVAPWQVEANWTANDTWLPGIGIVEQSTRGIAVRDNISYGVALLETNLSYGETFTSYSDNRKAMTGEDDRTFTKADAKLSLKGILIGGQISEVDWQFLRKNTAANATEYHDDNAMVDPSLFNRVVYDEFLGENKNVPLDNPNYTLVFDNYNSSDAQNKVRVALEFVNGGDPFWGKQNIIPSGGTFYLIGELDPANPKSGSEIKWNKATRQIPPVYVPGETRPTGKELGDSKEIARVFIQDYMTVANFKLNANSLKNAYLSIPDLRSAQMSLGLSVDLEWKTGFAYDINL